MIEAKSPTFSRLRTPSTTLSMLAAGMMPSALLRNLATNSSVVMKVPASGDGVPFGNRFSAAKVWPRALISTRDGRLEGLSASAWTLAG